jgi:hypothetical protein
VAKGSISSTVNRQESSLVVPPALKLVSGIVCGYFNRRPAKRAMRFESSRRIACVCSLTTKLLVAKRRVTSAKKAVRTGNPPGKERLWGGGVVPMHKAPQVANPEAVSARLFSGESSVRDV